MLTSGLHAHMHGHVCAHNSKQRIIRDSGDHMLVGASGSRHGSWFPRLQELGERTCRMEQRLPGGDHVALWPGGPHQ